jgi:hypothetical protein
LPNPKPTKHLWKIKMLCFDNGDEFAPKEFNAFRELHGIIQQFTNF